MKALWLRFAVSTFLLFSQFGCVANQSILQQPRIWTNSGHEFFESDEDPEYFWTTGEWSELVKRSRQGDLGAQNDVYWTLRQASRLRGYRGNDDSITELIQAAKSGNRFALGHVATLLRSLGPQALKWERWRRQLRFLGRDFDSAMSALEDKLGWPKAVVRGSFYHIIEMSKAGSFHVVFNLSRREEIRFEPYDFRDLSDSLLQSSMGYNLTSVEIYIFRLFVNGRFVGEQQLQIMGNHSVDTFTIGFSDLFFENGHNTIDLFWDNLKNDATLDLDDVHYECW